MEKKGTYGYIICCKYCDFEKPVYIEQGIAPSEFATEHDEKCPRCKVDPPDWEAVKAL